MYISISMYNVYDNRMINSVLAILNMYNGKPKKKHVMKNNESCLTSELSFYSI